MKMLISIIVLFFVVSCDSEKTTKQAKSINTIVENSKIDTFKHNNNGVLLSLINNLIPSIKPDYFEIPYDKFEEYKLKKPTWFFSKKDSSRLYIVPYTDYSITTAVLIKQDIENPSLIDLLQSEGIDIKYSKEKVVNLNTIISVNGVHLGMEREPFLNLYGSPDSSNETTQHQNSHWTFKAIEDTTVQFGGLRPFMIDYLPFEVEAQFKNNKLTQLIYKYGVP